MGRWRLWLGLALVVLLAACASPQRIAGAGAAFERSGRFAVNLQPFGGAPYAAQGGFAWRDELANENTRLDLSTPLGSTVARLLVRPGHALLVRADGSQIEAPDPDSLLAQLWGRALPVAGLRYWLQGRAAPGSVARAPQTDDSGRIVFLEQQGWEVRLGDYDALGPRRIRLQRLDAEGQWRLQLVVDNER